MLQIRRYQSIDKEAVWNLHVLALKEAGAFIGSGEWDRDFDKIEDIYLNSGGEFLVGLIDGKIIAMGALKRISADRAEIKRMRVNPAFQRRGFGQAILTELERQAELKGYRTLQLDTSTLQTAARGLYEKNGYKETRRGTLGGLKTIFYEKKLAKRMGS